MLYYVYITYDGRGRAAGGAVSEFWSQNLGLRFLVSEFWSQNFGLRFLVSDVWSQIFGLRFDIFSGELVPRIG